MKNLIYIANIEPLFNKELFNYYYEMMPNYRKEKIDRFKFQKDKCLSLGVGIILNKMLSDNNLKLTYELDKNDKPIMRECYYNLSHSEHYVMGIISNNEVGCDIEYNNRELLDIKKYFNELEIKYINDSKNKTKSFYKLWTLKESFMKCTGLGFKLNLHEFSVDIENNKINQNLNNCKYYFNTYELQDYTYSYCIKDLDVKFQIEEINFI